MFTVCESSGALHSLNRLPMLLMSFFVTACSIISIIATQQPTVTSQQPIANSHANSHQPSSYEPPACRQPTAASQQPASQQPTATSQQPASQSGHKAAITQHSKRESTREEMTHILHAFICWQPGDWLPARGSEFVKGGHS